MAEKKLQEMKVAILATNGFEQPEMTEPRKALEEAGAKTVLISPKPGKIYAMKHHDKGDLFNVDMTFAEAKPEDFDAVLLPGGALNADALRMDMKARQFVQQMDKAGKPFAIICHAPWLLVSAGLVKGRKMTSYHTIQDDLRNAGADWVDLEVVRDRNWVMSRQPKDIPAFNREVIDLFASRKG
jgi:protease I